MARILITSGPTRQYLDPVRYLTNASSGRMGAAIAQATMELGHEVTVVTGPVAIHYPTGARIVPVISTDEMLEACRTEFPNCVGLIGVAAPCDYRPVVVQKQKISKTGGPLRLELVETPDVVATIAAGKQPHQWVVGFALETEDQRFRAITKMQRKSCNMMVLNGPQAMDSGENEIEIFAEDGTSLGNCRGEKLDVARNLMRIIQQRLSQ